MQRKIDKKNVYNAGRSKADEELIHMHMCNHYRRILNAKKAVDNSPPYCYKVRRPASCKPSVTKSKENQTFEHLPLTDRSLSTNSNKESCWGAESFVGSSRYHARCIPDDAIHEPSRKYTFKEMDLVNRITFDTKRGPSVYCDIDWEEMKDQNNDKGYERGIQQRNSNMSANAKRRLPTTSVESAQKRKFAVQKKLKSSRLTAKGSKSFPSLDDKIYSKTFKTEAVSKLRSLRVYYPPRRKVSRVCMLVKFFCHPPVDNSDKTDNAESKSENSSNAQIPHALESPCCKCTKICVCDAPKKSSFNPKEQSLTSSRDSAYNGGVSSLPESRSPTPDQRRKKECCCCCCEKKQQEEKIFDPPKTLRVESPREPAQSNSSPVAKPNPPNPCIQQRESFAKLQEDALYVKFIQDITTEILDKNLYTNKALKKVMKKHIKNNARKLHKDRMLKEVENLRIQLGIPEDKTLLDDDPDGDLGASDVTKFYPIISDSEFVLPRNKLVDDEVGSTNDKPREEIPINIAGVTSTSRENKEKVSGSETEDEGVISVIQVTKTVRERRREQTVGEVPMGIAGRNSSDDSDRPSDPKKRSVLKNRKQKYLRIYSPSSSDSERSGKFCRKVREKTEFDVPGPNNEYLEDFVQVKKNRSVSFWKNPDLDLGGSFEVKQQKPVATTKDTVGREKRKND